jgi:hypothetical protein
LRWCSYGFGPPPSSSARRLREVGRTPSDHRLSLQACWPSTVSTLLF